MRSCRNFELDQLRFLNPKRVKTFNEEGIPLREEISRDNLQELTYLIRLRKTSYLTQLTSDLNALEHLENLRVNFKKQRTRL